MRVAPFDVEYQTALELAEGHRERLCGDHEEALSHFHRALVIDADCTDAAEAIRALDRAGAEQERLDRLLGARK